MRSTLNVAFRLGGRLASVSENSTVSKAAKFEDWEIPYYVGLGTAFLVTTVGLLFRPETSIREWGTDQGRKAVQQKPNSL